MKGQYLDKPIKETRICNFCGRKKTFVYIYREEMGGLWTKDNEPHLWYMDCPRCKKRGMVKEVVNK